MKIKECRSCGESIVWMETDGGKWMPVDADTIDDKEATVFDAEQGMVSHFATCKDAGKWRKS